MLMIRRCGLVDMGLGYMGNKVNSKVISMRDTKTTASTSVSKMHNRS